MAGKKDKTLGEAIRCAITRLREERYPGHGGKKKCAEDFGIHPQMWRDWENGHRTPGSAYQKKLSEFFGVSLAQLRGEGEPAPNLDNTQHPTSEEVIRLQQEVERLTRENDELRGALKQAQSQNMLQIYDNVWMDRV